MNHPYSNLPAKAFWSSGVAKLSAFSLSEIYQPRASIDKSTRVATAGSCFAQHISREFRLRNYNFLDLEPAPPMLPEHQHADFGFGIYSARYGNVYSIRQLLQIVKRANGDAGKQEPFWEKDDKFFDPYRPNIQKNGFADLEEAHKDRAFHLRTFLSLLEQTDLFIFTFGLTEAWVDIATGDVFPTCPGVAAGEFDANKHTFHNFSFSEFLADTDEFIEIS